MTWSFSHSPSISVSASLRLSTTSPYETTTSVSATIARPGAPPLELSREFSEFSRESPIFVESFLPGFCPGGESATEREGEAKLRTD